MSKKAAWLPNGTLASCVSTYTQVVLDCRHRVRYHALNAWGASSQSCRNRCKHHHRYTVRAIFRRALGQQGNLARRCTVGADMILS